MRVLFIHGGGDNAYAYDRKIVSELQAALGRDVKIDYPHFEGLERIDWPAAHAELRAVLCRSQESLVVVAHSIGAAALLKLLSTDDGFPISKAFLLAPPYKGHDSHWGVDDFTLPNHFANRLPHELEITIYHGSDDTTIPVSDARDYDETLPTAAVSILSGCDHQFSGFLDPITNDIKSALKAQ